MANLAAVADHPDLNVVVDTVLNADVVGRVMRDCDIVFHMAAVVGVGSSSRLPCRSIEIERPGHGFGSADGRRARAEVVLASTSEVYGKNTKLPFCEDDDRIMGPTTEAPMGLRRLQGDRRVPGARLLAGARRCRW